MRRLRQLPGQKETPCAKPAAKDKPKRGLLDYNAELFEDLRAIRKELANKAKVPPFVIFGDTSLQEMACYLPGQRRFFRHKRRGREEA